jgi:hypothetical protein
MLVSNLLIMALKTFTTKKFLSENPFKKCIHNYTQIHIVFACNFRGAVFLAGINGFRFPC